MTKRASPDSVPADPSQWSVESQRSVSAEWTKAYTTRHYNCWRCRSAAVFTAEDQRYTYEVKKASIDQQRILCESCWSRLHRVAADLAECERLWAESKPSLSKDTKFLERWSALLMERQEYVPYRPNVARKNMLAKLLRDAVAE